VKEHDQHWDSQQEVFDRNILLFKGKHNLNTSFNLYSILIVHNACKAFLFKCWSHSDDSHHWPKHIKALFYY
jgi:hypothetical protein